MKFFTTTITLLVLLGTAFCGPISISDNNIGDIVTIGVNVNANIETEVNTTIVNALVALLTQIGVDIHAHPDPPKPLPDVPKPIPEFKPIALPFEALDELENESNEENEGNVNQQSVEDESTEENVKEHEENDQQQSVDKLVQMVQKFLASNELH